MMGLSYPLEKELIERIVALIKENGLTFYEAMTVLEEAKAQVQECKVG